MVLVSLGWHDIDLILAAHNYQLLRDERYGESKNKSITQMSFDLFSRTPRIYIEITGSKGTIIWDRVDHKIKIYIRKYWYRKNLYKYNW